MKTVREASRSPRFSDATGGAFIIRRYLDRYCPVFGGDHNLCDVQRLIVAIPHPMIG